MSALDTFAASVTADQPPAGSSPALQALWWVRRGDWARAHECVQAHEGEADCDSVHAHLHREEGDLSNAGYWYRRAGRPVSQQSLEAEWTALATELLDRRER
ncbi:hypothetical protein KQ910_07780 [Reyranella sp. MMS21-HV4-11]|uniref:Uncharacterized protein n=1 Tax=Reyranella humidisoli TaxID=2849149 RepID=A0ABS6IGE7_9HYPH|nr:hypothetical protein [Reyranella sp. MMS21-HV4-11]MBU8873659.1 hypothetical protein [Reyranella sp. MMS21-HV4-11]